MTVGEMIRKLRKENKLTQAELANSIGVSKSSIEKYEANRTLPSSDIQDKLAKLFNIDKNIFIETAVQEVANTYIDRCLEIAKPIYEAEISMLKDTINTQANFIETLKELIDHLKKDNQELKITINKLFEVLEKDKK